MYDSMMYVTVAEIYFLLFHEQVALLICGTLQHTSTQIFHIFQIVRYLKVFKPLEIAGMVLLHAFIRPVKALKARLKTK